MNDMRSRSHSHSDEVEVEVVDGRCDRILFPAKMERHARSQEIFGALRRGFVLDFMTGKGGYFSTFVICCACRDLWAMLLLKVHLRWYVS